MTNNTTPIAPSTPKVCFHPLSCRKCDRRGGPCGDHNTTMREHSRCSGTEITPELAREAHKRETLIAERVRSFYRDYDRGFMTWEEFKDAVDDDIKTLLP